MSWEYDVMSVLPKDWQDEIRDNYNVELLAQRLSDYIVEQDKKLKEMNEAFEAVWDSLTDILSQEQVKRVERVHRYELKNLFME